MPTEKSKTGWVIAGLLLGLILSSLDQTVVSAAMPTVAKDLGGLRLYSWVFSAYMLASTTVMPIYGKLADQFGRKSMFLTGLLLFLAGSVLCGMAGTMTEMIIFRGVQGLGAGALMPVAFTIVGDLFPMERRGKFMGLFGTVFAVSSIFGPALGGVITDYADWSWIFWINVPLCIAAGLCVAAGLKESKGAGVKRKIDWLGALALSGAIVSLLLALVMGGVQFAWGSAAIIGLFAGGAALLGLLIVIERRAQEPMIPLHLFGLRTIAFGNLAGFFVSAGLFGAVAYIPYFAQEVTGVSPSVAGSLLTPLMLATVVTSTPSGWLMNRFSYRTILAASLSMMLIGFLMLSRMNGNTSLSWTVAWLIVTGLGMGAVYPTLGTAVQNAADRSQRGVATSSNQFFRSVGGTIGVSVMGVFHQSVGQVFLAGAAFVAVSLLAGIMIGSARLVSNKGEVR